MSRPLRSTRRPATMLVAAVGLAFLLASCGTPHPGLSNGSVSGCYRAIPVGRAALHNSHVTLIGVHRLTADQVRPNLPPAAQTVLAGDNDTSVCALSFKGTFTAGQVQQAPPAEQGDYAVVLVTTRQLKLLVSAVLPTLPKAFGKRII